MAVYNISIENRKFEFQLIDSRGFEYSFFNIKKSIKDMKAWVKSGLKDKKPRIYMLWFCVDAISRRFTKTTFKTVEEAIRDSEKAVKKYDFKCKRMKSQTLTIAAATSGGVVGAITINFSDAVILSSLETALITGIVQIYKLDNSKESTKKIITRIVKAGTVSIIAKAEINQLNLFRELQILP